MKTEVEKSIEQYEKITKELSAIKHLEGVRFIDSDVVYLVDQTYKKNLKKVAEIEKLIKIKLSLARYFECYGKLALIYRSDEFLLKFALYCTDLQETLNLFGCKLVTHEALEKSYSIECEV